VRETHGTALRAPREKYWGMVTIRVVQADWPALLEGAEAAHLPKCSSPVDVSAGPRGCAEAAQNPVRVLSLAEKHGPPKQIQS
jgi:hypothetical protein